MNKKEFGVFLGTESTYSDMLELALKAEALGFNLAVVDDHIDCNKPEAWTTMTGIGIQTSNIRIGHAVLTNGLRHPGYLAKSISTLDNIINGRYEIYIGPSWKELEYQAYDLMGNGQGMPSVSERVERLKETIQILRLMLSQEVSSFNGKFWKLKDAKNIPLPIHQPKKILIGTHNLPVMEIVANFGDGIDIFCGYNGNYNHGIKEINNFKSTLEKEKKSRKDFLISLSTVITMADTDKEAIKFAKDNKYQIKEDEFDNYLIGSPETIIDRLKSIDADRFIIGINMEQKYGHSLDYFKNNVIDRL